MEISQERKVERPSVQAPPATAESQLLSALRQVSHTAQSTLDPDAVIKAVGTELEKLDLHCAVLLLNVTRSDRLALRYVSSPPPLLRKIQRLLKVKLSGLRIQQEVAEDLDVQGIVHFRPEDASAALPGLARPLVQRAARLVGLNPGALIARVPLRTADRLLGALLIWGNSLEESALPTYSMFAGQIAITLNSQRTLKAERRARAQAETLREVAGALSASLDLDQVLDLILKHLAEVLVFDAASVLLTRPEGYFVAAAWGGARGAAVGTTVRRYLMPAVDAVVEKNRTVIISDAHVDPNWAPLPDGDEVRSWLGVPLAVKDKIIGALTISLNRPEAYHKDEAALARAFAQQAALAIENARLFVEVRRYAHEMERRVMDRTRELETLHDVTTITSEPLDLKTVLLRSMQSVFPSVRSQGGALYLNDEETRALRLAAHIGLPSEFFEYPDSPLAATGLLERVLAHGRPLLEQHAGPSGSEEANWTYAALPMRFRGRTEGILVICSDGVQTFSPEEQALLVSFADHVAAAVENARLRQQTQRLAILQEREKLAQDLHDSVTQSLYSLSLFAEAARDQMAVGDTARSQEYVDDIAATARRALREMRLLIFELRSDSYLEDGLLAALHHRVDAVEKRAGIKANVDMDSLLELPTKVEKALYRVAREALNNSLKHAQAEQVQVTVFVEEGCAVMEVTDNGCGFDLDAAEESGGMGLGGMYQRVDDVDGTLEIISHPDQGTRVLVTVPLESE